MTKTVDCLESYILIVQYNDKIEQFFLNNGEKEQICGSDTMVRRHMVRGHNDQIYFVETQG